MKMLIITFDYLTYSGTIKYNLLCFNEGYVSTDGEFYNDKVYIKKYAYKPKEF